MAASVSLTLPPAQQPLQPLQVTVATPPTSRPSPPLAVPAPSQPNTQPPAPADKTTAHPLAWAGVAYVLGHLIKFVPVEGLSKQTSAALISPDPRQLGKAGLGLVAVHQFNKALGWTVPPWLNALETIGVVHSLMLPLQRKSIAHLALTVPLVLASVMGTAYFHDKLENQLDKHPDTVSDKKKDVIMNLSHLGVMATSIVFTLALYPRAFMALAKRGGGVLKPLIGQQGSDELRSMAYKYLIRAEGTPESKRMAALKVADPLPEEWQGIDSLQHHVKHHRSIIRDITTDFSVMKHLLQGTLLDQPALLEQVAKNRQFRFNVDELKAFAKDFQPACATKSALRPFVEAVDAELAQLGTGTYGDDFERYATIQTLFKTNKHLLMDQHPGLQYVLHSVRYQAEHSYDHRPQAIPFFTLLGAEGAAMTCTNGCCVGSLWCWADIADTLAPQLAHLKHGLALLTGLAVAQPTSTPPQEAPAT